MALSSDLRKEHEKHSLAYREGKLGNGVAAAREASSDSVKPSAVSPNAPSPLCLVLVNLRTAALSGNQFLAVCRSQLPRKAAGMGSAG